MKDSKMEIWEKVEVTDPSWLKVKKEGGRDVQTINPQKQMKQATELWGAYGSTWGLRNLKHTVLDLKDDVKHIMLCCEFYYPNGSFEISNMAVYCYVSSNGRYIHDENCLKKLETNTRSKSLSFLGFGSDVFEGMYNDSSYSLMAMAAVDEKMPAAQIKAATKNLNTYTTIKALNERWNSRPNWQKDETLQEVYNDVSQTLKMLNQNG